MKLEMINYIFFAMGLFLMALGIIIWVGKKVEMIHGEDANKIRPEDVGPYSRNSGIGVVLVSLAAIAYGLLKAFPEIPVYFQWIAVLVLGGLGILIILLSRKKYFNR